MKSRVILEILACVCLVSAQRKQGRAAVRSEGRAISRVTAGGASQVGLKAERGGGGLLTTPTHPPRLLMNKLSGEEASFNANLRREKATMTPVPEEPPQSQQQPWPPSPLPEHQPATRC